MYSRFSIAPAIVVLQELEFRGLQDFRERYEDSSAMPNWELNKERNFLITPNCEKKTIRPAAYPAKAFNQCNGLPMTLTLVVMQQSDGFGESGLLKISLRYPEQRCVFRQE